MKPMKKVWWKLLAAMPAAACPFAHAAGDAALPVMSTTISLLMVLAAIAAVAFVFKRLSGGRPAQRILRIVSHMPLGAREKISVVELDGRWLVLGVTSQQITLLAQMKPKPPEESTANVVNFSRFLNLARGKHDPS